MAKSSAKWASIDISTLFVEATIASPLKSRHTDHANTIPVLDGEDTHAASVFSFQNSPEFVEERLR